MRNLTAQMNFECPRAPLDQTIQSGKIYANVNGAWLLDEFPTAGKKAREVRYMGVPRLGALQHVVCGRARSEDS